MTRRLLAPLAALLILAAVAVSIGRALTATAAPTRLTACWTTDRTVDWASCARLQRANHVAAAAKIRELRAELRSVSHGVVVDECLDELVWRESR